MAENQQPDQTAERSSGERERQIRRRIARAIARTRLILLWEDLWPRLVPLLAIAGLFALSSWFGLWLVLSDWMHVVVLSLFAAAALASLWPLLRVHLPSRAEAFKACRHSRPPGWPPAWAHGWRRATACCWTDRSERARRILPAR